MHLQPKSENLNIGFLDNFGMNLMRYPLSNLHSHTLTMVGGSSPTFQGSTMASPEPHQQLGFTVPSFERSAGG